MTRGTDHPTAPDDPTLRRDLIETLRILSPLPAEEGLPDDDEMAPPHGIPSATAAGVTGINHVTLAVSDVERALVFYRDILGCTVRAVWRDGAYLEAGSLWLCLALDEQLQSASRPDHSHIAFGVVAADYPVLRERLMACCVIWKEDRSEGASTYFRDPDGHKLEIHLGTLSSRLDHYRANPDKGVRVFDR